tara:strand:+ start:1096 stop:1653 length:558 start_codon:yes stop_codon:yes gene_type:complete
MTNALQQRTAAIVERIIRDDILVNASTMIDSLSRSTYVDFEGGPALPSVDDLAPVLSQPDYSEAPEGYTVRFATCVLAGFKGDVPDLRDGWEWINEETNECDGLYSTEREALKAAWEDSDEDVPEREALQHYIVSDWLGDKLEEQGAMVVRDVLGFTIWGRAECGQCLTMDYDLNRVAAALALVS